MSLTPDTGAIVARIMGGLLERKSTIRPLSRRGRQQPSVAGLGAMAVLPVMAITCLWYRETLSTLELTGAVAKRVVGCKLGQSFVASRLTTGRLAIGS